MSKTPLTAKRKAEILADVVERKDALVPLLQRLEAEVAALKADLWMIEIMAVCARDELTDKILADLRDKYDQTILTRDEAAATARQHREAIHRLITNRRDLSDRQRIALMAGIAWIDRSTFEHGEVVSIQDGQHRAVWPLIVRETD